MTNVNNFAPAAFSIDGARHQGELLRAFAFAATGGREGVVVSSDCKVVPLSTPGPQVGITAGPVAMRTRSAGAVSQSYVGLNRQLSYVDVAPSGGSPRSDLVIVRVKDPQFDPWKSIVGVNDPAVFQYVEPLIIQNVPNTTTSAAQLNLGYSAYALARIDLPAGTINVTEAMIKELRSIIQPAHDPKEARTVRVWQPPTETLDLTTKVPHAWFPKTNELIFCPPWATRASIIVTLNSLLFRGSACYGNIRAEYGWNNDTELLVTESSGFHQGSTVRQTLVVAGTFAIPASFRNKAHYIRTGGVLDGTASADAKVTQDKWSTVIVDVQFEETAD